MNKKTSFFDYGCSVGAIVDIGRKRRTNEDEVIVCPEAGFYAVSDGMGGVANGGQTSLFIKKTLPEQIKASMRKIMKSASPEHIARLLTNQIQKLNDQVYCDDKLGNRSESAGATLSGVWLTGGHAVFVNVGDSRGYLLPRRGKKIKQITDDHNVAALLVKKGIISKEVASFHPGNHILTRFVGKKSTSPDIFIKEVHPGDSILLCSDGLHGMVNDSDLPSIMRSSANPVNVCEQLVAKANHKGGRDNISVVYIQIN